MAAAAAAPTPTTLPFLLISLLLILFISCSAIATPTHEGQGQQVPSSVTPKAAAVHYWHLQTRSNRPPPPIFLSKLSPLSPFKLITTNVDTMQAMMSEGDKAKIQESGDMEMIDDQFPIIYTHAPHDRHPSASGDMEMIDDQFPIIYTHAPHDHHRSASGDMEEIDDQFPLIYYTHTPHEWHPSSSDDMEEIDDQFPLIYYTHTLHDLHPSASDDMETIDDTHAPVDKLKEKAAEHKPSSRGTFYFRESELKEGKMIPFLKFVGRGSSKYFLPRSIASKIPFSASAVSKIFPIRTDSAMYRAMKTTVGVCRMPPNTGETKQCVTSAEDMIDYVLSILGANTDIQVWSTHNLSGFEGKSLIGKVEVVYDGELTAKNHVTCHKETFPYLVYACHNVFKTRVYDLEILDAETKERINRGAALCHLDTSAWSPDNPSLAAVGSAPGKTEVCHWVAPWDMVWTAAGHVAE